MELKQLPSLFHAVSLVPLIVLFSWLNFGQSADVSIVKIALQSNEQAEDGSFYPGPTLTIDIGDFYDWYSECLSAGRGAKLASWTAPGVLFTFLLLYVVPLCRRPKSCCGLAPLERRATTAVLLACIAVQLAAVVCMRVGYDLVVQDVKASCCDRTDFSDVGANARDAPNDEEHEFIWNSYCTMTGCECDFESQRGGKFVTGPFYGVVVALWAASVVGICTQRYIGSKEEAKGEGGEMMEKV